MTPAGLTGRELAALLAVVVIWGMNFVVMKAGLRDFTPFQLGAARYVLAVLPAVLLVRPPRIHWKWVVLYGLCQGVGQFGLLFLALKVGMTAALASVLLQTQVFFTALFGFVLLHERASKPLQLGMGLAALGLGCFAMNYLAPGTHRHRRHHRAGPGPDAVRRRHVGQLQHRGAPGATALPGLLAAGVCGVEQLGGDPAFCRFVPGV